MPFGYAAFKAPASCQRRDNAVRGDRSGSDEKHSEAAALYAFARAKNVKVLCLAHVTNTMGQSGADFEKGEAGGTSDALEALERIVTALRDA